MTRVGIEGRIPLLRIFHAMCKMDIFTVYCRTFQADNCREFDTQRRIKIKQSCGLAGVISYDADVITE